MTHHIKCGNNQNLVLTEVICGSNRFHFVKVAILSWIYAGCNLFSLFFQFIYLFHIINNNIAFVGIPLYTAVRTHLIDRFGYQDCELVQIGEHYRLDNMYNDNGELFGKCLLAIVIHTDNSAYASLRNIISYYFEQLIDAYHYIILSSFNVFTITQKTK